MKQYLTQTWLDDLKMIHRPGNSPGLDLRYDEVFMQIKNQNVALKPDPAWMLEHSAALLFKSLDWRICIYALHAAAILGNSEMIAIAFNAYAFTVNEKFNESFPAGDRQKLATFDWCKSSYIVKHLMTHQENFSSEQLVSIQTALNQMGQSISDNTGERVKWHDLDDFLVNQIKLRGTGAQLNEKPKSSTEETDLAIDNSREAKPFFDKYVLALLKEGEFQRAISLSRAHRWSPLIIPPHKNNKTQLLISQQVIDKVHRQFDKKDWEKTVWEAENLFLHPHAQYFMKINFWSYTALIQMGEKEAAECIEINLKKLYKNYGQVFAFMYNEGQMFADSDTLAWIVGLSHETPAVIVPNDPLSLLDMDVVQMNAWIQKHEIITKKDAYMNDYFYLKILKNERKDISLIPPLRALFDRSISEYLYAWEPELAKRIWGFYADQLKEEKPMNKNNWEHLMQTLASINLPVALQLMKQS